MSYLLDTNACIDFLLGRSDPLARRIGSTLGQLAVSAVTAAELHVGSRTSSEPAQDQRRVDTFLAILTTLPFDAEAAVAYGRMVRAIGARRGSFDRLIAAQAVVTGRILVTNNERDFADIPGLIVENWTVA